MWYKAYILTFDKNDTIGTVEFHEKLINTNGIESWWHYLESTYILIVKSHITASNVSEYIKKIVGEQFFFVTEINMKNHNGWLLQEAWDWINKQNQNIQ